MSAKGQGRILIVDADTGEAQKLGLALDSAGFEVAWATFSPNEVASLLRDFKPELLLVHGEIGSPQLSTLLARLESASAFEVPVVLLCKDLADEPLVRAMKTGVVELLPEPFSARLHVGRLKLVLAELPGRPGMVRGRGAPGEVQAMVNHVVRTRRTGGLVLQDKQEGSAFFVRGVLKSARLGQETMHGALASLSRATRPWVFTEGAEGTAGVVELDTPTAFAQTFRQQGPALRAQSTEVAEDGPGQGSGMMFGDAMDLDLPPPPPPPAPPAQAAPAAGVAEPPPDPAAAQTPILFVDDEPTVVSMMANYFRRKGYPVATARDGVEALEQLVANQFEVVIADLNMPRLDGWGLLRFLREDFRTHEVPVALYSAHDDYREKLRLLHAGAQAFFPKSLRLSVLEAQVRELAEPRRRFLRLVEGEATLAHDFGSLGPQWVLRQLAGRRFTGQLDARDSWATWRLWLENGRLLQANSTVGGTVLSGDGALASFLSSKQVEGTLSKGDRAPQEGFQGAGTAEVLNRLVQRLNEEHGRAREDQLSRAKALVVSDELYRLYATVGPPAWLPIARLLCEQKLTPAEVIARMQVTPMEVAAVVKDMLRRGVVSLRA